MKKATYLKSILLVALTGAMIYGFWHLYRSSNSTDMGVQEKTLAAINRLKQIDANWDAQVLKSWVGMERDYDVLSATVKEMHGAVADLNNSMSPFLTSEAQGALRELEKLDKEKADLTEKFKRRNSVLKNSLRYLPTVQSEIKVLMSSEGKTKSSLDQHESIDQLVSIVLQYNLFPEERLAASVQLQNESVRLSLGSLSPALAEKVSNLVKHVDVILAERQTLALMIAKINSSPIAEQLDSLSSEVAKGSVADANNSGKYSRYLQYYAVAMLMLFLMVVAFVTNRMAIMQEQLARRPA